LKDAAWVAKSRERLQSLSWFMKCLVTLALSDRRPSPDRFNARGDARRVFAGQLPGYLRLARSPHVDHFSEPGRWCPALLGRAQALVAWIFPRQPGTRARFRLSDRSAGSVSCLGPTKETSFSTSSHARRIRGCLFCNGITGNSKMLSRFRSAATWLWQHWLSRRGRGRRMTWERFARFLKHKPLPAPIAIHSACRPVANM
jgi:hypothetical protein